MKLTDKDCKAAKALEKPYKLFDGGGLYLQVNPNASKLWRLKYRFNNKEKLLSIGAYPIVTLAQARQERHKAKTLLSQNPPIDPMALKNEHRREAIRSAENSFKAVAEEWLETKAEDWSVGYRQKNIRILELYIYPHFAQTPIKDITPPMLLVALREIETKRKAFDIARKARELAGMIFRYGIQSGKCEWNAAENLKGALKSVKTTHYAALDENRLPDFLKALERNEARIFERTRRAVWFSILTFQRPGEIRQAQWSEIDFEAKEWRIAEGKMKMRRAHIVPLSLQAIEILKQQKEETGRLDTDWVFPSQVRLKQAMSDGTVNKAIQRLGFGEESKAHGFRALARTLIRERLNYDSEIIEKQLAHKTSNPLGEAYDRTQFLDKRVKMMQDWADYLDVLAKQEKVIRGNFG